ncbi:glucosaminidase domain-containing protein [Clostridium tertium]|uniref:glucosaminidase domain-containing protein n=1 Tax=Clostridium tertium TaxID=1559 RepID=UPI0023B24C5C|nr:glucosaminidase domain-containing protein [Clostridium tertium]
MNRKIDSKKINTVLMYILGVICIYTLSSNTQLREDIDLLKQNVVNTDESLNKNDITIEDISDRLENLSNANEALNNEKEIMKQKEQEQTNIIEKLKDELQDKDNRIKEMSKVVIYDVNNIGSPSGATYSHMRRALKDTPLESLAEAFVDAEKQYNVNAFFLAGLAANESNWGTSSRATNDNNLTGHAVYTNYSRGTYFDSKAQSIIDTAEDIRRDYLNPDGIYNNGVNLSGINVKYSQINGEPNPAWYSVIDSIACDLVVKANQIPIITN